MTSLIFHQVDCYRKQSKNSEKKKSLNNTDETHASFPRIPVRRRG